MAIDSLHTRVSVVSYTRPVIIIIVYIASYTIIKLLSELQAKLQAGPEKRDLAPY